jgi:MULE transposase domain
VVPILEGRDEKVSFHAPIENVVILTRLIICRSTVPIEVRQRKGVSRRPIGCGMKLKKKIFDDHVEIERHGDCEQHCHSMEYADIRKKNSAVRQNGGCEVSRGYRAGQVRATLTAQPALLEETGASFLSAQDLRNAGAKHQNENPNARGQRLATDISWQTQRDEAEHWLLNNSYLAKQISATRECDGEPSEGLVFALPDRLEVLADRGMLTLMDATHDSNKLKWLLYTVMVRNQYGSFVPTAHILTQKEDSDIVAVALREIRGYCRDRWTPKWVLTDDSAGKTFKIFQYVLS